jgi:uncharacterized protein
MIFKRAITDKVIDYLQPGKVARIYGPRRVGKTTFVKQIIDTVKLDTLFINGDETKYYPYFEEQSVDAMSRLVGNHELLVIDEAQLVPNIGISLKILVDSNPRIKVIVTGSSVLGLGQRIGEPLVGRSWTYRLGSLSFQELEQFQSTRIFHSSTLKYRMIYGSYPELFNLTSDKDRQAYLIDLRDNYLYRDLTDLNIINKPRIVGKLLQLLAYQVGSELSLAELAAKLQIDSKTVEKYLYLLEESFIIFRLSGFRRNLRVEVTKFGKYYFWDLGVRNALIESFSDFEFRDDIGKLWENFLIVEKRKAASQPGISYGDYFWRSKTGSEIDYIIDSGGKLKAYEFKWSKDNARAPKTFLETYKDSSFKLINNQNFRDFLEE